VVPPSTVALPPAPDPRIRTRVYSPDTIYRVYGHTGYQIMVQLEPDDRVQTIAIGDASGWQITPNEGRNLVFLKPLRPTLRTNMSIVTDRRTYNFELSAFNGTNARPSDLTYVLRFHYPQPAGAKAAASDQPVLGPGPFNRAYSFEGSDLNVPAQVFDDGKVTYFRFPDGAPRPAIFVLDPGAGESIVNVAYRGPYSVVDRVAPVFILKQGREVTRLYNDGFTAPDLGAEAPRRRTNAKKKRS
jgi:type IV secretion system protein VirB9